MPRLDQYRIGELLGEGGIGRVHAAYDTVLSREVAIKSLHPARVGVPGFVERFRAEATNLARLNHPNVTTVYDLLEKGCSLYIVMERVHGSTLEHTLRQCKAGLGIAKSLAIFAQVADGLAYAHSKGIIHRDIKPANIMIAPSGLVKIMDFGIARLRDSDHMTKDGQIIGTLAYMAPEQLRGEPADERSDLYSLGMVLYEMLTGSPPFAAASERELYQAQLRSKPRPLRDLLPDTDPRIDAALMRALAKKPNQRFTSIMKLKNAVVADAPRPRMRESLRRTAQFASRMAARAKLASTMAAIRANFERVPDKGRIPLIAGVTALLSALIVWGIWGVSTNHLSPTVLEAQVHAAPALEAKKVSNTSVILPEPELHAGR
jgi:serine/threonine protein kinase